MSAPGDISCKQLFAHPELVCELLRAALPLPWLQALSPAALRRVNGSYVSGGGKKRHSDMVWKLNRHPGQPVYLMLEFQSHPDYWMALRMQVYAGLLCQELARQSHRGGKLALLLPLVLYTGCEPWRAGTDLATLHEELPPGLASLQPEQKYLLVDQSKLRAVPADKRCVIASLLEFEQASEDTDLLFALGHINDWVASQRRPLLRQFVHGWVVQRLRNEFRGLAIPPEITLLEVHAMFNQRFATPEELWEYQAVQRARKQGREEGLEEGRQEGCEAGRLAGAVEERRRLVLRLLERGRTVNKIPLRHIDEADGAQLEAWIDALVAGEVPAALR
jgi:hypothetical protein